MGQKPPGQNHLLLVAAGQLLDGRVRGGRLNFKQADVFVGKGLGLGPGNGL